MSIITSEEYINILNDDLTMRNYLALLVCIVNPKMTYSRVIRLFEINCEGDRRRNLL